MCVGGDNERIVWKLATGNKGKRQVLPTPPPSREPVAKEQDSGDQQVVLGRVGPGRQQRQGSAGAGTGGTGEALEGQQGLPHHMK